MGDQKLLGTVARGIAQLLDTHPSFTYRADGRYGAGENPVTFGAMHPHADVTACVTPYDDAPGAAHEAWVYVQVRTRHSDYLDGLDAVDGIRDLLHDRRYVQLDTITASRVLLDSFLPLGRDGNGRHEWSQNFRLLLARPPAASTPEGTIP